MSRRHEGPTRVVEALERYLQRSGIAERVEEAAVVPEWAERVGDRIAAVTRPLRVSRGTLFVAVRSSAWLMELKLMEGEILERLNEDRPRGRIKKIRFLMDEEAAGPDTR